MLAIKDMLPMLPIWRPRMFMEILKIILVRHAYFSLKSSIIKYKITFLTGLLSNAYVGLCTLMLSK